MTSNKIIGGVLAMFFVLSEFVYAQGQRLNVDDMVARMKTEFNLTQQQADAVKPIIKEYITKRQEFLQNLEGQMMVDKVAIKNEMKKLKQDEYQSLSGVFNADQMKQWVNKENLRARLNPDGTEIQIEQGTTLTPDGANFQF